MLLGVAGPVCTVLIVVLLALLVARLKPRALFIVRDLVDSADLVEASRFDQLETAAGVLMEHSGSAAATR